MILIDEVAHEDDAGYFRVGGQGPGLGLGQTPVKVPPPHPAQDSARLVDVSHNLGVSDHQQSRLGPGDRVQAGQPGPGDLTHPVSQILVIIKLENDKSR